ncbi:MAG: chemotaxis protein CheW [Enterocloster bolteae]
MADKALKAVLCIPGKRRNYAVEFPYVEEICKDVMISLMPCLPEHFAGVCNYKGSIVPVVCQEGPEPGREEADARQMVLVLRHQKYYLGHPFVSGALSDPDERG